jgi:hypothetical protein
MQKENRGCRTGGVGPLKEFKIQRIQRKRTRTRTRGGGGGAGALQADLDTLSR